MKNTLIITIYIMFIISASLYCSESSTFPGSEGTVYINDTIFNNFFINRDYNGSYIDLQRIAFSYTRRIN